MSGASLSIVKSGKMTLNEYRSLHRWVAKKLGRPMWCWHCKDTLKGKYTWANKSGNYEKNIFDWLRLCHMCHQAYDKYGAKPLDYCKRGHSMTGDNLYVTPGRGYRECVRCKRLRNRINMYKSRHANALLST